jgi:serine phosphatase RsbU (regulator of sigma subunit)
MQLGENYQLFSFYYIVVIMGGLWFRVTGGAITAAFCNFFFLFFLVRAANDADLAIPTATIGRIALDTGLLFLVGCLVGYMSEAQEIERQRRLEDQLLIANYQREIDLSTQLQPLLFSTESGETPANSRRLDPHLEVGVAMQAARTLGGGDYFDILPLPGGKTALFIADVSGKSVRAQARLPLLKYALRALAPLYPEPATLMQRLNENLAPDLQRELFIALCCVILDPQHKTLAWCNAGHIAPLLVPQAPPEAADEENADPPILPLETDGPALGMFPDTMYESRTLPWLPGDQLLMFTDGLVDALSYGGTEDGEAQVRHLCGRLTARQSSAQAETKYLVDMAITAFDAATPLAERLVAPVTASSKQLASGTMPATSNRDDVTVALIRHRD